MSALADFATSVSNHTGAVAGINPKGRRVGFDPMSVIMMLSTILPPILEAFRNCRKKRQETVDPVAMRNSVYGNMQHFATSSRQEMAMAKEIDKELQRQKKLAAKASKGGGVIPDYIRFDLDATTRQRLAHNIISKFANCSNEEVIDLVKDADGIYKTQTA